MKLVTKIEVTYNDPNSVASQQSSILEAELIQENPSVWENDFNTIGANYQYKDLNGAIVHIAGFRCFDEEIESLYNAVKTEIPAGLNYRETTRYIFYFAFRIEMAKTFGITVNDIEIVA